MGRRTVISVAGLLKWSDFAPISFDLIPANGIDPIKLSVE